MGSKDRKATRQLRRRAIWWVALGVALALASLLATTNDAQAAGEIDLVLKGQDARSWHVANLWPGQTGTFSVTLRNAGSRDGRVTIWLSDIVNSEGPNPESETGSTDEPGELGAYLLLGVSGEGLVTNVEMPATLASMPQDPGSSAYVRLPRLGAGQTVTLEWRWILPPPTGNDVQGDGVVLSVNYALEEIVDGGSGGSSSTTTTAYTHTSKYPWAGGWPTTTTSPSSDDWPTTTTTNAPGSGDGSTTTTATTVPGADGSSTTTTTTGSETGSSTTTTTSSLGIGGSLAIPPPPGPGGGGPYAPPAPNGSGGGSIVTPGAAGLYPTEMLSGAGDSRLAARMMARATLQATTVSQISSPSTTASGRGNTPASDPRTSGGVPLEIPIILLSLVLPGGMVVLAFWPRPSMEFVTGEDEADRRTVKPLSIEMRNRRGKLLTFPRDVKLLLSTSSDSGTFSAEGRAGRSARDLSLILPAGHSAVRLTYTDTTAGTHTLTARRRHRLRWNTSHHEVTISPAASGSERPALKVLSTRPIPTAASIREAADGTLRPWT